MDDAPGGVLLQCFYAQKFFSGPINRRDKWRPISHRAIESGKNRAPSLEMTPGSAVACRRGDAMPPPPGHDAPV
jgi:hypothetical protein